MSLQNILKQETINEEWSQLYAYIVNATEFVGGGIPRILTNKYDTTKFSVQVGTGSVVGVNNVEINYNGSTYSIDGNLRVTGVTGVLNGGVTLFSVRFNILPLVIVDPVPFTDQLLNGACSSTLYTPANRYITTSVITVRDSSEIILTIHALGNFTAPDPNRILDIQFSCKFKV